MVSLCVIRVCLFLKGRFVLKKEHLQHLLDFWRQKILRHLVVETACIPERC